MRRFQVFNSAVMHKIAIGVVEENWGFPSDFVRELRNNIDEFFLTVIGQNGASWVVNCHDVKETDSVLFVTECCESCPKNFGVKSFVIFGYRYDGEAFPFQVVAVDIVHRICSKDNASGKEVRDAL